jgi:hypothetical protein
MPALQLNKCGLPVIRLTAAGKSEYEIECCAPAAETRACFAGVDDVAITNSMSGENKMKRHDIREGRLCGWPLSKPTSRASSLACLQQE